jgi:hypothetical protein
MKIDRKKLEELIREETKRLHQKTLLENKLGEIDSELEMLSELSKKKKRQNIELQKQKEKEEAEKAAKDSENSGGLKRREFTDQEIWDAMRGSVQKDRKKEKQKYGSGRKDKHKGKGWS